MSGNTNLNPMLLTLSIDEKSLQFFNALRNQYFPPERNFLDAHLMLFHQLPPNESAILSEIEAIVIEHNLFVLKVSGISSIGNGVAYKVESDFLQQIHKRLQLLWQQWLIPQDKNKLWPHITIQNKVDPSVAKQLLQELLVDFIPFDIQATGLSLWEYQGGPWKHIEDYLFSG